MARVRERTSARETAYAEKHRILQALEEFARPENWSQFKEIRRAYKKFRTKRRDAGDRYDRKALLQDCEDRGLIDADEHKLITNAWDASVDSILAGMDKALSKVRKGDQLNCWIVYGGADGDDCVVHRRVGDAIEIEIRTRKWPRPGPYKFVGRMDPGFMRRLKAHHEAIGAMLEELGRGPGRTKTSRRRQRQASSGSR
jgi:hypothetical protein